MTNILLHDLFSESAMYIPMNISDLCKTKSMNVNLLPSEIKDL